MSLLISSIRRWTRSKICAQLSNTMKRLWERRFLFGGMPGRVNVSIRNMQFEGMTIGAIERHGNHAEILVEHAIIVKNMDDAVSDTRWLVWPGLPDDRRFIPKPGRTPGLPGYSG